MKIKDSNVIILVVDSLRLDHVGVYHRGNKRFEAISPCNTPNLDRFSENCMIFENAYPEALPTIPFRIALMTGQRTLPFRGWEPLRDNDITITEILKQEGYTCGFISDVDHYRAAGMNFHKGFDEYRWIRGQEYDPYNSAPTRRNINKYTNDKYDKTWKKRISQFLANTDEFKTIDDWFSAKVVEESIGWLKRNRKQNKKFLFIDCFDPHEPWDPPKDFDTYTDSNYKGKRLILPMGGEMDKWATQEEVNYIRGLYAGEVTSVDYQLGKLFNFFYKEGYMENSIIVLVADHGHPLGDHGKFLKGTDRMYSELLKIPFMIHLPGNKNAKIRTEALVQNHDVLPTILDLLGMNNNISAMHGNSLLPVLKGETNEHYKAIITGYFSPATPRGDTHRCERCIRDKEWSYIMIPDGRDELYNLKNDWKEEKNIITSYPEEAKRLSNMFGAYFKDRSAGPIKGIQGRYEMSSSSLE